MIGSDNCYRLPMLALIPNPNVYFVQGDQVYARRGNLCPAAQSSLACDYSNAGIIERFVLSDVVHTLKPKLQRIDSTCSLSSLRRLHRLLA